MYFFAIIYNFYKDIYYCVNPVAFSVITLFIKVTCIKNNDNIN